MKHLCLGILAVLLVLRTGPAAAAPPVPSTDWAVVYGTVTAVNGSVITVRTPAIRPYYPPGVMHPMYIVAPRAFRFDIEKAAFQYADGSPSIRQPVTEGESLVVLVAQKKGEHLKDTLNKGPAYPASVVERLETSTPGAAPTKVPVKPAASPSSVKATPP